jgi:L-alanine-DL-glutamate epimerase-like enolase superfamily enzyme
MDLRVSRIDRTYVELPLRETPAEYIPWKLPGHGYFEVVEVELESGAVGYGDQYLFVHGETGDGTVRRVRGSNAASLLWDDSLSQSLQIALFDATARATSVPVHDLLGEQVHEETPLAWWCLDYAAEDWLAECETAIDRGYTDVKLKGRIWQDVRHQVSTLSEELPDWFHLGIDFNGTLIDADRGIPVLQELEEYPQVALYETPIPQEDVDGNERIRRAVETPLAQHYGDPPALTQLTAGTCDGFVLYPPEANAAQLMRDGAVATMAGRPSWLQILGTGITTAFAVHAGSVIEGATWPAVTCYELFAESLLTDPIELEDGATPVPDSPGLGYAVDVDAIERFEVDDVSAIDADPPRLIEVEWPDGPTAYFSSRRQLHAYALEDNLPYFERGVTTRNVPDDGSGEWKDLHERARDDPVVEPA